MDLCTLVIRAPKVDHNCSPKYSEMETNSNLGDGGKSEAPQDAAAEGDQVDH